MDAPPPAKRPRLSMACNECRRRKVKCDAEYPKCRNCSQRNATCMTTDPKRPGLPVVREWIEDKIVSATAGPSAVSNAVQNQNEIRSQNQTHETQSSPSASKQSNTTPSEMNPTSTEEVNEVSPVYHPYQMSFHADHGTNRIKMMGGSSGQCLMKSLDLYLAAANIKPVSSSFQYGMRHSEEMEIPLAFTFPPFPPLDARQQYLHIYFRKIHVLWPIFNIDEMKNAVHSFASITNLASVSRDQIPLLASAYLIMSLGADEDAQGLTPDGDKYLEAASTLIGHIIQVPYLPAVQALLTFAITYRGRNKEGLAWQMMGMAIRIGHTLGLHKHSAVQPSSEHGITHKKDQLFHARIWAVCCCIEKMLQLESGRPSAINSVDRDQMMGQLQRAPGHDFLQWNMGLAEYQSNISQHIYSHKPRDRTAKEILQDTARLDGCLEAWARDIPAEFRPGNELFCSRDDFHVAAFLSIQWHQTMIALHRAALIAPAGTFDAEVDQYCSESPANFRLKRGELICVNSARSIIRLSLDLAEHKSESRILTATPALLACAALGIFLMKNPGGRAQAADLELLKAAVDYTGDHFTKSGQDRRVAQGIFSLHEKVRLRIRQHDNKQKRAHQEAKQSKSQQTTPASRAGDINDPRVQQTSPELARKLPSPNSTNSIHATLASFPSTASNIVLPPLHNSNQNLNHGNTLDGHVQESQNAGLANGSGWTPISHDREFAHLLNSGSPGDSLFINQEMGLNADSMPFGQFNVEDLWDWMFVMGSTDSSQPIYAPNNV